MPEISLPGVFRKFSGTAILKKILTGEKEKVILIE
jgi:hypothetical protein